uniref:Uncharacterized protein n=1 Tax=Plectus sambesii TaxID=2011161 RepID=A0A914VZC2_9BILA
MFGLRNTATLGANAQAHTLRRIADSAAANELPSDRKRGGSDRLFRQSARDKGKGAQRERRRRRERRRLRSLHSGKGDCVSDRPTTIMKRGGVGTAATCGLWRRTVGPRPRTATYLPKDRSSLCAGRPVAFMGNAGATLVVPTPSKAAISRVTTRSGVDIADIEDNKVGALSRQLPTKATTVSAVSTRTLAH